MIQSFKNSLPSLSLQIFSVRQVQDKWAALMPLEQRDLTITAVSVLVFSLMVFTAAYKLARYCFTPIRTLTLSDGGSGEVSNETFHKGVLLVKGDGYEATFKNLKLQGQEGKLEAEGEIKLGTEGVLKGTFHNGVLLVKGDGYEATLKNLKLQGQEGKLEAEGEIKLRTGEVLNGTFHNGVLVKGKITLLGGDSYEGTFDNLKLQGKGTSTVNGVKYEGEFKDGELIKGTNDNSRRDCYTS